MAAPRLHDAFHGQVAEGDHDTGIRGGSDNDNDGGPGAQHQLHAYFLERSFEYRRLVALRAKVS